MTPIAGLTIKFRPLQPADFDLIVEWRAMPHVARWLGKADRGRIEYQLMERMESGWRFPNLALMGSRPIGYLEYFVAGLSEGTFGLEDARGLLGLEFLIGPPDLQGKGLGHAMVRQAISMLFREDAVTGLLASVDRANDAASILLSHAGFASVGTFNGAALMRRDRQPSD